MFLRHQLPGLVWALVILFVCGIPGTGSEGNSLWDNLHVDKLAHLGMYALLTLFLIVGFRKQNWSIKLRLKAIPAAFVLAILYGGVIEWLQGTVFVGRSAELPDFIADGFGCALGCVAFIAIYGQRLVKRVET